MGNMLRLIISALIMLCEGLILNHMGVWYSQLGVLDDFDSYDVLHVGEYIMKCKEVLIL